jgi:hypothetical protein
MLNRKLTIAAALAGLGPLSVFGANRRVSYDELAAASDKVVLGAVGVKSSHWGDDAHIYTDIVIYPDVTIKGVDEGPLTIEILGGTVGDTTMSVSDGPELPAGERVVVFLKKESGRFVVVGRSAGAMNAGSPDAPNAIESTLAHSNSGAGARLQNRRALADTFLRRETAPTASGTTAHAATQVGCYSTDGAHWDATSAAYKIGAGFPSSWTATIDTSASTWNNVGAAFRLVNDSSSVNELSLKDLVATYGSSYSNTFAVTTTWSSTSTGVISRATIEVNNKWAWSLNADPSGPDVQNIITHEFGHWLRLLDIYSPATCGDVTMWGSAAFGETKKRTLEQPDIDGFLTLYTRTPATVGAPVLASPANGATGVAAGAALSWTAAANATSYDVYLGTTASPALVATVTGTSFQPAALTAGSTYYWRVVAKNSSGSATSATYSFTVAAATGGVTAGLTLLSPADGATGVSLTPLMQWTAVSGANTYDIYIGTSPSPSLIGSINATAVTVTGFQSGVVYYWRVVGRTASSSVSSAVGSFKTN